LPLACLVLFAATLLGGCISNTPVDLALASVQAVDWRDQDEMPGPGASPILGLVPTRDLALMGQSVTGGPKPPRLLLKVEFTSTLNLAKFAIDNSYSLGSIAHAYDRSADAYAGFASPVIYWQGQRLGQHEPDPIERRRGPASEPIRYYFFTNVARVGPPQPGQDDFNLLRSPQDICFTLRGGSNSGFGYQSNTVVIPKAVIAAALRKLPPGFGG
jgi:hypothetical protein